MTSQEPLSIDTGALQDALLALAGSLEPDQTLRYAVENACHLLGAQSAAIGLANPQNQVEFVATIENDHISLQNNLTLHCLEITPDQKAEKKRAYLDRFLQQAKTGSAFAVPLVAGPCLYGYIAVGYNTAYSFTPADERLLTMLAGHIILSLQRSASYAEVKQERDNLQRILSEIDHGHRAGTANGLYYPQAIAQFLNNIPEAVILIDTSGKIVYTNQNVQTLLGIGPDPASQDIREWITALNLRHVDGRALENGELPLLRALNDEIVIDMPIRFVNQRTGREQYFRNTSAPIRDEHGQISAALLLASDITRAQELDKLRNEFLSLAGHELKTPITSIKGFGQFIRRRLRQADPATAKNPDALVQIYPKVLEQLETMLGQVDRLTGMINDLLDLSRLQTGRFEYDMMDIDFRDLVSQTVDRISMTWKDSEQVRMDLPDHPVPVVGDSIRLDQVITNLVMNALKYSPEGSPVAVRLWTEGAATHLDVSDQGIGIAPEDQEKLFSQFYRASNARSEFSGLGLGLYISKEIVTRHGGKIWVDSVQGQGSTFHVMLPLGTGGGEQA